MSCYLVQEVDGTSRFTLEDGSGSILLEFCAPVGGDLIAGGPVRRGRRRRREIIEDEELMILSVIDEL